MFIYLTQVLHWKSASLVIGPFESQFFYSLLVSNQSFCCFFKIKRCLCNQVRVSVMSIWIFRLKILCYIVCLWLFLEMDVDSFFFVEGIEDITREPNIETPRMTSMRIMTSWHSAEGIMYCQRGRKSGCLLQKEE